MSQNHIQKLAALFNVGRIVDLPAGSLLFRGCWLPGETFPGGHWFAPTKDGAAQYIAQGAGAGRTNRHTPFIFEGACKASVRVVELPGNHVESFEQAYGRCWTHGELTVDIPAALAALAVGHLDGFIRERNDEIFLCEPGVLLSCLHVTAGDQALAFTSDLKQHKV